MNFIEFKKIIHEGKDEKILKGSIMYKWHRMISANLSWLLVRFVPAVKANHVSLCNIFLLFIVIFLTSIVSSHNAYYLVIAQLLILNFTSILDKTDGELARFYKTFTQKGMFYDISYHFFYPFAFFYSVSYFFYITSGNISILILGIFLGMISMHNKFLGKIKNHVLVKIKKEKCENKIVDYSTVNKNKKRPIMPFRILNYFIFQIYDWTWFLFLSLVILHGMNKIFAFTIFYIFICISIIFTINKILFIYPTKSLFSREEIN